MQSGTGREVITRFAPSPSGHLHIGGARTALFNWAYARRMGGRFLLRIEDTDQARSSDASERAILHDLAWLGILWDEGPEWKAAGGSFGGDPRGVGPFRQSERLGIYEEHIERLMERGLAYAAFEGPEELEASRQAAIARKETYRYDRGALSIPLEERMARVRAGEAHVVRLRVPDGEGVSVRDEVLGEVSFGPGEIDDFVLRKRDGYPTYHFAVVVDDALMGVTHVLRGQEHLANTPRHVLLQKALGFATPVYAHMPLIFNDKGAKMSKRERDQAAREAVKSVGLEEPPVGSIGRDVFEVWRVDKAKQLDPAHLKELAQAMGLHLPEVSVEDFRSAGYFPEVIDNFIALMGYTPSKKEEGTDREKFDLDFLQKDFGIEKLGKSNARFDRVKLASFNADAIGAMSDEAFAERWREWLEAYDRPTLEALGEERLVVAARAVKPRCKVLSEASGAIGFVLIQDDEVEYDEKAVGKVLTKGEPLGVVVLAEVREALTRVSEWRAEEIERACNEFASEKGLGMGKVAQPLRVAVTGGTVSPGLGDTLELLGKRSTMGRIDMCLRACGVG